MRNILDFFEKSKKNHIFTRKVNLMLLNWEYIISNVGYLIQIFLTMD